MERARLKGGQQEVGIWKDGIGPLRAPKTLDHFNTDERLAGAVKKSGTISELRCNSENSSYSIRTALHRVVWASMDNSSVIRLKQVLRAPRKVMDEKPCGCARALVAPQKGFAMWLREAKGREQKVERARDAWKEAVQRVEAELCGVTGLFEQDKPNQKWCGRGKGTDVALRPAIPSRTSGQQGSLNWEDHTGTCGHSTVWSKYASLLEKWRPAQG